MRILLLLSSLLVFTSVQAQDVYLDKLTTTGGTYQIPNYQDLPDVWLLEKEVVVKDAKAIAITLNAPPGSRLFFEVSSMGGQSKTQQNKKRNDRRKDRMFKSAAGARSWQLDFSGSDGKISKILENKLLNAPSQGIGFLFPDACSKNPKYLLRLVIDFRSINRSDAANVSFFTTTPVSFSINYSPTPSSQATLFKFPSEKNASEAVILMRTSGVGPEVLHFTTSKNGVPSDYGTLPVDNYYFGGQGVFTRVYAGGQYLSGPKVSMHHVSPDFDSIYSVCVSLSRKRQELEGYH